MARRLFIADEITKVGFHKASDTLGREKGLRVWRDGATKKLFFRSISSVGVSEKKWELKPGTEIFLDTKTGKVWFEIMDTVAVANPEWAFIVQANGAAHYRAEQLKEYFGLEQERIFYSIPDYKPGASGYGGDSVKTLKERALSMDYKKVCII